MRKGIAVIVAVLLSVCGLCTIGRKMMVSAAPAEAQVDTFSGAVGLLKQENNNYVFQVTVENRGEDFSGTVQVIFSGTTDGNCAYNTELTLPAQGKKQFTLTVTEQAVNKVSGLCALNFLDEKGRMLQSIPLSNIFGNKTTGISVGILSDDYSGLTYLDAGGRSLNIRSGSYPLRLIELNQENLRGYLDGLYFLVIDRFNVSTLAEEDIEAIQDWVKGGGWLIIGTGAYAEQTLSGFSEDFMEVEVLGVSEPGEANKISIEADKYGNYYNYRAAGIDFTQIAIADLGYDRTGIFYENMEFPGIYASIEEGAVSILLLSLGEPDMQKLETYVVQDLYTETMYRSSSYYTYDAYSDTERVGRRALAFIDNNSTKVDFTWLEVLIGIYVVLIGPVLYLILRKCKKSEWYWVCVPALGLVFIGGVFFFGQGARVNETKVYSVTAQRGGSNWADTYFLAYHSGVKEWNVRMQEDYEVAGPGLNGYYWGYNSNASDYYYVVNNDSEGLSVGIKPQENFDNGFLYAGKRAENKGTFSGMDIWVSGVSGNVRGTVRNDTICDLAYMAIWSGSYMMVFSDVKAGETLELQQAVQDGRCVYQDTTTYFNNLLYDMVGIYERPNIVCEQEDMAALLVGLGIAERTRSAEGDQVAIVGLVKDYDKTVTSKCVEVSYGCLYSYVKAEVEDDAAD